MLRFRAYFGFVLCIYATGCSEAPTEAEAAPTVATSLRAVSPTDVEFVAGDTTGSVLAVRAEAADGTPVQGVAISWTGPSSLTLIALNDTTEADGRALLRVVPSDTTGEYAVSASTKAGQVMFSVHVVPQDTPPDQLDDTFTAVTAGIAHTCALGASGLAYCWGRNLSGALGTGDRLRRTEPTAVRGWLRFQSLHAGAYHTCGLARDGKVYCWGMAVSAALGIRPEEASDSCSDSFRAYPCELLPRRVPTDLVFASLWAFQHTCGVTADGAAYCWGINDFGQLGGASAQTCTATFGSVPCSSTPVRVEGAMSWQSLTAGWSQSCGVAADGTGYCWGSGRLGIGHAGGTRTPTPVTRVTAFDAIDIGAAICGTGDDEGWCWGLGYLGQLGTEEETDSCTLFGSEVACALNPVRVAGEATYARISTGRSIDVIAAHACALDQAGAAYCWGSNNNGELGTEATEECVEPGHNSTRPCARVPVPVDGGLSFRHLAAAASHTCAVTQSGDIYCWGYNLNGELGEGSRVSRQVPMRVGRARASDATPPVAGEPRAAPTSAARVLIGGRVP